MNPQLRLLTFALVAILGIVAVVALILSLPVDPVEAKSFIGECASGLKNASASLCHLFL